MQLAFWFFYSMLLMATPAIAQVIPVPAAPIQEAAPQAPPIPVPAAAMPAEENEEYGLDLDRRQPIVYPPAGPLPVAGFQKHAVIMIAINYSEGEIAAARSAALARGEEFHLVPELTPALKKMGLERYAIEQFSHRQVDPLVVAKNTASGTQKKALTKKLKLAVAQLDAMEKKSYRTQLEPLDVMAQTRAKIKALEARGVGVDSLVISGHDGGGTFGGTFGTTSVQVLSSIAEEDKKFKSSLRSVYLLGCYTATTDQARDWKGYFPHVEMVAGYDQAAPLRDAPKGWNYVHDTMVLERKLTGSKDLKELNLLANQVKDINKSFTAFSTFPKCDDPKDQKQFYRGKITKNIVIDFDIKMCNDALPEFEKNLAIYKDYALGRRPLPEDTSSSDLRELYTFYRNHEICYGAGIGIGPHAQEVFFLLFNRGVRANFAKYYAKSIKSVASELAAIDLDKTKTEAEKTFAMLSEKKTKKELNDAEINSYYEARALLKMFKKYPTELSQMKRGLAKLADPELFKAMPLSEIRKMASNGSTHFDFLQSYEYFKNTQNKDNLLSERFSSIIGALNTQVIARRCLPMSWHEESKGMPETPNCED